MTGYFSLGKPIASYKNTVANLSLLKRYRRYKNKLKNVFKRYSLNFFEKENW
jgi:hypothetical protein